MLVLHPSSILRVSIILLNNSVNHATPISVPNFNKDITLSFHHLESIFDLPYPNFIVILLVPFKIDPLDSTICSPI